MCPQCEYTLNNRTNRIIASVPPAPILRPAPIASDPQDDLPPAWLKRSSCVSPKIRAALCQRHEGLYNGGQWLSGLIFVREALRCPPRCGFFLPFTSSDRRRTQVGRKSEGIPNQPDEWGRIRRCQQGIWMCEIFEGSEGICVITNGYLFF